MATVVSVLLAFGVYYGLYYTLFDDFEDLIFQIKSLVAWLPITFLLDYDFSDASWRTYVWLPSGMLVGAFLYSLLS